MNVSRQNKLNFGDPLFDSLCFGLRPFVVLLEVVGEIAIQIETSCVISENMKQKKIIGKKIVQCFNGKLIRFISQPFYNVEISEK